MKRIFSILIIILGIHGLISAYVEADNRTIEQLINQVSNTSVTIERQVLEDIALRTYTVLANIPFVGIQSSQTEIQNVIILKNRLEAHTGLLERLLAIRMHDAINRSLFFETYRRALNLMGKTFTPPYKIDTLNPETIIVFLEKNTIAEQAQIQYIKSLNGQFAQFCRSKNFGINDFLNGEVVRGFPSDLRTLLREMQSSLNFIVEEMDKKDMEDVLFVSLLTTIDRTKDVRILCDILLYDLPASYKILLRQIEQRLLLHPYFRVSSGTYSTSDEVHATAETYLGHREEDYPELFTLLFLPYFRNTETNIGIIDDILSKYAGEHREFDNSRFPLGKWLW